MNDLRIRSGQPVKGQVGVFVGEGYHPNSPHHITLSGLTIETCGGGVTLYGDEHLIHGSRIADNNFGHGVFLKGNKVRFSYNEFENNGLAPPDSFVHSLYMSDSQDVVFEYNEVHSATDGVKARRVDRAVFRNNIIHDVIKLGIHLGGDYSGGASGNRIESNLFYRNGADIVIKSESGTQVDAIDGLVIANNVVRARSPRGATGYGASVVLDAVPMREVWVVNNLLFGLGDVDGIRIRNTGEDVRCLNNIVTRSETSEAFAFETSVIEGGNLTFPHEAGLSPLHLAQTNAYDFSPTAASTLLIDQGVDVSPVLKFDFAGEPRLIGDQVDIGPFEFDPAESAAGIQP
jgi:hypothetical protein